MKDMDEKIVQKWGKGRKQDILGMNTAPMFNHSFWINRSLSSVDQKILTTLPPPFFYLHRRSSDHIEINGSLYIDHWRSSRCLLSPVHRLSSLCWSVFLSCCLSVLIYLNSSSLFIEIRPEAFLVFFDVSPYFWLSVFLSLCLSVTLSFCLSSFQIIQVHWISPGSPLIPWIVFLSYCHSVIVSFCLSLS